jgi:hypothetical protein
MVDPVLCLDFTPCIPEISSPFLMTSLLILSSLVYPGHAVAHWLRHCGTNRKVAGSIPGGVTGIFR